MCWGRGGVGKGGGEERELEEMSSRRSWLWLAETHRAKASLSDERHRRIAAVKFDAKPFATMTRTAAGPSTTKRRCGRSARVASETAAHYGAAAGAAAETSNRPMDGTLRTRLPADAAAISSVAPFWAVAAGAVVAGVGAPLDVAARGAPLRRSNCRACWWRCPLCPRRCSVSAAPAHTCWCASASFANAHGCYCVPGLTSGTAAAGVAAVAGVAAGKAGAAADPSGTIGPWVEGRTRPTVAFWSLRIRPGSRQTMPPAYARA